jgi:hypothetical protein
MALVKERGLRFMSAQTRSTPIAVARGILRIVLWLLLIPLVLLLSWWLANRIDEAPSAAALHYAAPSARRVADAENGWLYLVGNGAAVTVDPMLHAWRVLRWRPQMQPKLRCLHRRCLWCVLMPSAMAVLSYVQSGSSIVCTGQRDIGRCWNTCKAPIACVSPDFSSY